MILEIASSFSLLAMTEISNLQLKKTFDLQTALQSAVWRTGETETN